MPAKNSKAIFFILVTVLIDVIGIGIIIPIMPSLYQELTGGTVSEASQYSAYLVFIYAIMQFIFSPIIGGLSDQYGRKRHNGHTKNGRYYSFHDFKFKLFFQKNPAEKKSDLITLKFSVTGLF